MAMTHMCLGTLQGTAASTALVAGVSLVSSLLASDWARVSNPAGQFFSIYHYYRLIPESCAACCPRTLGLVNLLASVKLSLIWSLVDMLDCSTKQIFSKIFCAVLAIESWSYCSGRQGLTAQHPLLHVWPNGFIEQEAVGLPALCHLVAGELT